VVHQEYRVTHSLPLSPTQGAEYTPANLVVNREFMDLSKISREFQGRLLPLAKDPKFGTASVPRNAPTDCIGSILQTPSMGVPGGGNWMTALAHWYVCARCIDVMLKIFWSTSFVQLTTDLSETCLGNCKLIEGHRDQFKKNFEGVEKVCAAPELTLSTKQVARCVVAFKDPHCRYEEVPALSANHSPSSLPLAAMRSRCTNNPFR
jgi:hypothetical protein